MAWLKRARLARRAPTLGVAATYSQLPSIHELPLLHTTWLSTMLASKTMVGSGMYAICQAQALP
ncbi:hypothetical protein BC826DRAFT_158214 [Russula brevipes]|nr:hypothetical protein BC826DRAFT_158214 [Russula brevipes]